MAQAQRYKLTLSKLDFVSLVDDPAQPNATTLLIKRKGKTDGLEAVAKYIDADESLGLAWFWAFTSTEKSGEPHYDHHGDQVAADGEMVRAVMDYMKRGGAVDEMHDYEQKSNVVFAMPVTAEVAKAIGIQQTGLLVTIKCTPEQIVKLKDGTYTGVSIAGMGTRELVEACKSLGGKPVRKTVSLFTDSVEGHQHQLDVCEDGSIYCSWATSTGADNGHSHAVARDTNGAIVILDDSGHSHQLADGQPAVIVVPEGAVVVTEVAMRRLPIAPSPTTNTASSAKRAQESPRPIVATTVKAQPEGTMTTEAEKIAQLEKSIALISKLSTTEHALWKSLDKAEADAFLAKSVGDRAPMVAEFAKRDEVVYTADDGAVYRKSADANLVAMAKRLDESERARKEVDVAKRAGDMFGATKPEDGSHVDLVKAIDSISDGTKREGVTKLVGQLIATSRIGKAAPGASGEAVTPETTAAEQLDALTAEYATKNNVDRPAARVAVMKTADGKRLYAESVGRA